MGAMMTTSPGGIDMRTLDRWTPLRCDAGKRIADTNAARRQVRLKCDGCHRMHTVDVGDLASPHVHD